MEPETIINRSFIENFSSPQSDYVTILSIVPSMTGGEASSYSAHFMAKQARLIAKNSQGAPGICRCAC
jgi:hypothetical protein